MKRKPNPVFEAKVQDFLRSIQKDFPFLGSQHLLIETSNSFPHSAGIASSASAMSALALCLCSLDILHGGKLPEDFSAKHPTMQGWVLAVQPDPSILNSVSGERPTWFHSAPIQYALASPVHYHANFNDIQDTILLVSRSEKSVSSRAGHALMDKHPMARIRYRNAVVRLEKLLSVLTTGDWSAFASIVEAEALELHALMMTSDPSYILMTPNTLDIIQRIRDFRERTQLPVCFTLDAGPNVHVLYPYYEKESAQFHPEGIAATLPG